MIGRIVGGTYRIVEKVGEGGMGAVYRAVDTMLDREVAIKAIRPELAREPRIAERFRAEAKILARLSHPAVATIYRFFQEGEELFLAMEFVHGRSLSQVLSLEGALPWRRAVPLLCAALDGIEQAHKLGIIHRDIKPDNLMLTGGDGIKVMDFGIARMAGSGHLTRTGLLVGTLRYMAPEQIRGEEVDARTDVYSLGAVLYEALTAKVPFDGPTDYSILKAQLEDMPPRPTSIVPDLPLWVEEAILKSLAKDPAARFQTAAELRAFLVRNSSTTPVPELLGRGLTSELPTMVLPKTAVASAPTRETDRPRLGPPQRTPALAPMPPPVPPPVAPAPLPVSSATSYRPVSGAAWKIVAAAAFVLLGVTAGIFFWPRSGGQDTDETDDTPTPSPSLTPTVAESSPIAIAPAAQPSPRQTVPVRPSPRPEPPARQQPVVLPPTVAEPSLAPPVREESPRVEPTPAPPVREQTPVAPEPAPLDIGTERARELGESLEAASNQLIEVYKQFLDQKDERGEDLTDADEDLEEEIESMIGAAERLNNQIRNNLTRLREKRQTPQGRTDLRNRALKMAANIQKVETLMNEVQPGPEVLKVWRQVTGLWRQVARAAGV